MLNIGLQSKGFPLSSEYLCLKRKADAIHLQPYLPLPLQLPVHNEALSPSRILGMQMSKAAALCKLKFDITV